MSEDKKTKVRFPNVYALLFLLCVFAMLLTWIVPAGTFKRVAVGNISRVIAGSFHYIDGNPQSSPNLCVNSFRR